MIKTAIYADRPVALRYPRGAGYGIAMDQEPAILPLGRGELLIEGGDVTIIAIGSTVYPALEAAAILKGKGIGASVINARFVKPLDRELIIGEARRTGHLITVEENALQGGFGSAVLELLEEERITGVNVKRIGIPDRFIEQGSQAQLRKDLGLDGAGIAAATEAFLTHKGKSPSLARIK
jgi:1-deoxy-D-xylulose-5-phosphate synthase